jgi:hypothetical protein
LNGNRCHLLGFRFTAFLSRIIEGGGASEAARGRATHSKGHCRKDPRAKESVSRAKPVGYFQHDGVRVEFSSV